MGLPCSSIVTQAENESRVTQGFQDEKEGPVRPPFFMLSALRRAITVSIGANRMNGTFQTPCQWLVRRNRR